LFGMPAPAARPEARTTPSGQNQAVIVWHGLLDRVALYQSESSPPACFGEEMLH
jgi:hypothetical protein